ncbi:AAA family ATPase [Desertihabitans aurantiacus]|uniref:AAA family ATPase n=1 Tax=Desertihabitans aurantiacus TaxID=2282477 RepID=UPI001300619A|nr:AAA family ATPase [Desertihabitans aurantiacus]
MTEHRPDTSPEVVFVGGVPGAGKSTVLRGLPATPGTTVLDPEQVTAALRARLGTAVPYRWLRPVVHAVQYLRVLGHLLAPRPDLRRLLVHDTATRPWLRHLEAELARRCGWRTTLVLIETSRAEALAGQRARGRVLDPGRFDGHWDRWLRLRAQLGTDPVVPAQPPWDRVVLTTRGGAADALRSQPTALGA